MSFAKLEDAITVPLFPLRIVLFPAGRHDLQIFERRYIDMVTDCLKSGTPFGICSIEAGTEARTADSSQSVSRIGTLARIIDWNQLDNGLLGVTIEGTTKFCVEDCWESDTDLLMGEVVLSEGDTIDGEPVAYSDEFDELVEVLKGLEEHPLVAEKNLDIEHENLWQLGWHLSGLIPMGENIRQALLELDDPKARAESLMQLLKELAGED